MYLITNLIASWARYCKCRYWCHFEYMMKLIPSFFTYFCHSSPVHWQPPTLSWTWRIQILYLLQSSCRLWWSRGRSPHTLSIEWEHFETMFTLWNSSKWNADSNSLYVNTSNFKVCLLFSNQTAVPWRLICTAVVFE